MRIKGTKYKSIDVLPKGSVPVSQYAKEEGVKIGTIYMRYKRFAYGYKTNAGNNSRTDDPGFEIRCYKGMNYIVFP